MTAKLHFQANKLTLGERVMALANTTLGAHKGESAEPHEPNKTGKLVGGGMGGSRSQAERVE